MKKSLIALFLTFSIIGYSQENETEDNSTLDQFLNNLSGSLESNAQWYTNDKKFGEFNDPNFPLDDEHFRANTYLKLDYNFLKNFTVGIQAESYEPLPLLNYYTEYKGTNIATYYANYRDEKLDITAGHFYDQFGSGLLLRAFEERQLGLNNALRGGRINYRPTDFLDFTALYGQPRIGFKTSDSQIFGFDSNFDLTNAFNSESGNSVSLGFSYVGKQQDYIPADASVDTSNFPEMVNSYSARIDADFGKFYASAEYNIKGEDAIYSSAAIGLPQIIDDKFFDGNALLFTLGYTKKGLGVTGTFRRMENMGFFADREFSNPAGNNFNMLSVNYVPSLTKQQDYSLTNIYIYQPQPSLQIQNFAGQAGEIGGQFDLFYKIKKGTTLGGKYGTKISANFSYWSLLDATFDQTNATYDAEFLKFGSRLNRDFNMEIRKKMSKNWSGILTYQNTIIDKGVTLGGPLGVQGDIKANIVAAEATHRLGNGKSLRFEAQHLWTDQDLKNWAGATLEFVASKSLAFYVNDAYNYGNDIKDDRIHYYNVGGSYTKGASRIALNYGRQRGGLLCVGGVCRFVPENTGLTINLSTSF